ncbi:hypothetical protein DL98DRAFT_509133 [Cadophora sp. DSE1049]|nr:hypothetical protein DL98DRAFT_509133 [Cadophora sp. DSE1049]
MQFNFVAAVMAMASVALAAETVTVTECGCTSTSALSTYAGVASSTAAPVASTGVVTAPTATGSPITYATGAASLNGVSALGMIVAGGVALFL